MFQSIILCSVSCNNPTKKQNPADLQGTISISGAFAMYPLTVKWVEEFKKLHPKVTIDVSAGGAGKGMVDVLNGLVDIAMFSREVSPEEQAKGAWYHRCRQRCSITDHQHYQPCLQK